MRVKSRHVVDAVLQIRRGLVLNHGKEGGFEGLEIVRETAPKCRFNKTAGRQHDVKNSGGDRVWVRFSLIGFHSAAEGEKALDWIHLTTGDSKLETIASHTVKTEQLNAGLTGGARGIDSKS
jgi:hypothetical protein